MDFIENHSGSGELQRKIFVLLHFHEAPQTPDLERPGQVAFPATWPWGCWTPGERQIIPQRSAL
jgi:hypothetical protein